ncbi:MAG: hypothetical protein JNG90_03530, partial [Planctomycetaceae bacterium]|nr:hypothetical protein [Planctomycetaceae bacterium]
MLSSRLFWQQFLGSAGVVLLLGFALGAGVLPGVEQRLRDELGGRLQATAAELSADAAATL